MKVFPKGVPPMIIRPWRSYVARDVEVNGSRYSVHMIEVIMDFTSVDACTEMCRTLRPGFTLLSTTQVKTHIYSKNPEEMCHFFELKHEETAVKWRLEERHQVPPLFTVLHGCPYPSE
jgi:hypothetical protein